MIDENNLPTLYKGIPIRQWKSPKLLASLTDDEMHELHCLLYLHMMEDVERRLRASDFFEADFVIGCIMDGLDE